MNKWEIASAVLGSAILPCLAVALLAGVADALVALELASGLAVSALLTLAEGFQRQPFVDLGLVLAFLSLIGSVVFARFLEADS